MCGIYGLICSPERYEKIDKEYKIPHRLSYDKIDKCYCRGEHVHTIHSTIKFENVIIENTHMAH